MNWNAREADFSGRELPLKQRFKYTICGSISEEREHILLCKQIVIYDEALPIPGRKIVSFGVKFLPPSFPPNQMGREIVRFVEILIHLYARSVAKTNAAADAQSSANSAHAADAVARDGAGAKN